MDKSLQEMKEKCHLIYQQMIDTPQNEISTSDLNILQQAITLLDSGEIRVAEPSQNDWILNAWVKEAIIAFIHYSTPNELKSYQVPYRDHFDYKYNHSNIPNRTRIVPNTHVRYGAYINEGCVIMPSFINIGAYIGELTMIDSCCSIGSGAQIGSHSHISAGTGIGGVLEPVQAKPTIIEDHCFIGARSEISEGIIVRQGAVLASGMFISQSTAIYNRMTGEISFGEIPKNAVVVPGSIPGKDGKHSIAAAIIVKVADDQTRSKTQINTLLREGLNHIDSK